MSRIFEAARLMWREMHDEYSEELERRKQLADEECHGYLVNRAGKAKGISSDDLFQGSVDRAYSFASRELLDHWQEHGRMTLAEFEADWLRSRGDDDESVLHQEAYGA